MLENVLEENNAEFLLFKDKEDFEEEQDRKKFEQFLEL